LNECSTRVVVEEILGHVNGFEQLFVDQGVCLRVAGCRGWWRGRVSILAVEDLPSSGALLQLLKHPGAVLDLRDIGFSELTSMGKVLVADVSWHAPV
jgi:hypothetical protein